MGASRRSLASSLPLFLLACVACGGESGDETPPTVLSHTPAPDATNVSVQTPIEVTFSEPIDPASVTDATVLLAGDGSVELAKTLDLSDDGLVLRIEPLSMLTLPESLTVALTSGIRDEAGNALVETSFSWAMPEWLSLGEEPVFGYDATFAIYAPLLADAGEGSLLVAWTTEDAPYAGLRRWDGASWEDLPAFHDGTEPLVVHDLAVADDGRVFVVWLASDVTSDFFVSVWDGSDWAQLGDGLLLNGAYYPSAAALAVNGAGQPIVAWSEKSSPGVGAADLYVARWNGTSWDALGDKLEVNPDAPIEDIDVVVDLEGDPIVSWGERSFMSSFVKRWDPDAGTWEAIGGSVSTMESASHVAVLPGGEVVTAVLTGTGTIRVLRATPLGWETVVADLLTNFGWTADVPAVAVDSTGALVLAWVERWTNGRALYVARVTDGDVEYVGSELVFPAATNPFEPRLTLSNDVPTICVTQMEMSGSDYAVSSEVLRLNR